MPWVFTGTRGYKILNSNLKQKLNRRLPRPLKSLEDFTLILLCVILEMNNYQP